MTKRRLPNQKATGTKRSHEVSGGDSASSNDTPRLSVEIWEKPWIDFEILIKARLDILKTEDRRRRELELEYANSHELSVESPSKFSRICGLIRAAMTDDAPPSMDDPKTVQLNISEIVNRHRNRHARDPDYFERIRRAIHSAEAAAEHIDKMVNALLNIDDAQRDAFMFVANTLSLGRFEGDTLEDLAHDVLEAQLTMHLFGRALRLSTLEPLEQRRKGRPRVRYVLAAYELIEMWEALTGQKAVYPKGSAKGKAGKCEAVQPSTEFIRLALKMIDPEIKNAQAITCLKYVFGIKKSRENSPYARDHLIPQSVIHVMQTGRAVNDVEQAFLDHTKKIASLLNPISPVDRSPHRS
jgi:hypothetical protein